MPMQIMKRNRVFISWPHEIRRGIVGGGSAGVVVGVGVQFG